MIHILYLCYWSIFTRINENFRRIFNLFWIPISLAIVNPRKTLQFVINFKVFIKFHLASQFGLYLNNESKFSKIVKKKIFSQLYWSRITLWFLIWSKNWIFLYVKIYLINLKLITSWKYVIKRSFISTHQNKNELHNFLVKKLLNFLAQLSLFLRQTGMYYFLKCHTYK